MLLSSLHQWKQTVEQEDIRQRTGVNANKYIEPEGTFGQSD